MPCNEKFCTCWAFPKPLYHEEPIRVLLGIPCGVKPGTNVRTWLIDGAVRHMALGLTTRQLFAERCRTGLPAMSTEQSHRTGPKALAPWVPHPVTPTGEGSNWVQNWVVDIRINRVLVLARSHTDFKAELLFTVMGEKPHSSLGDSFIFVF